MSLLGRDGASVKVLWQEFFWEVDVTEAEGQGLFVDKPRGERGPVTVKGCVDQNEDLHETGCGWQVFKQWDHRTWI